MGVAPAVIWWCQVWRPAEEDLVVIGGGAYSSDAGWVLHRDVWSLHLAEALTYDARLAEYNAGSSEANATAGTDAAEAETPTPAGVVLVNLSFLDDLPLWATGTLVFGVPGACLISCCVAGLLRRRRRALLRKEAEEADRDDGH